MIMYHLIMLPEGSVYHAFTRRYSHKTYDLVKGGISIKRLLQIRSKDKMIMKLVKYMGLMMPYFMEEIEWMAAA